MTTKEISANVVKMASALLCRVISIGLVSSMFLAPLAEAANISSATRAKRAIYQYAYKGDLNALNRLKARGISLDTPDEKGNTALCSAVHFRNVAVYNTLVEAGADLNADCMNDIPKENVDRFCMNQNLADRSICSSVIGGSDGTGISATTLVLDAAAVGVVGVAAAAAISGHGGGGGGEDPSAACTTEADCNNHGSCTDGACVCKDGWSGTHCEIDPACAGIDCGAHGSCSAGACVCTDGWSGTNCEIEPACAGVDCGAHGSCSGGICTCTDDYTGSHCEIAPDTCKDIDCGKHGVCNAGKCTCTEGYSGDFCTIEPDPCYAVSCGAHGTCDPTIIKDGKGTCICEPEWGGDNCEIPPITKVPGTDAILIEEATLCDADKGYMLINGVCTKPFSTYTEGTDTTAISLTPDSSADEWAVVTNVDPTDVKKYPSRSAYLAEFGGSVANEGTIDWTGKTTQQVVMWANGVSKDAITPDGKNVTLSEASSATNTKTGTINATETTTTQAGVIAMKATSAGSIKNDGTINVTSLSPNYSAAMDASRYKENAANSGGNVENTGTINLIAKEKTQQLAGIDSLDRIILNNHGSKINITLDKATDAPTEVGEIVGMRGAMAVNRGTISVAANNTLATEDVIHAAVKAMEAAPNGSVYNDGVINLNLTNIKRSLYGLCTDAGGAGTKAVNNGTINVTGTLFNGKDEAGKEIGKQVYLMGSGDGTTTLINEGTIMVGEQNALDLTDKSGYLDVSNGGYLYVMDGGVQGTLTNNQKINLYLKSSGTSSPFHISAMITLQGSATNNGIIKADLAGSTNSASTFYAMDTSASQVLTLENNGIIEITSSLDKVSLAALNTQNKDALKTNGKMGKIYITSTANNSSMSITEGSGVTTNEGWVKLTHNGGSGNITGVHGGNRGSIYIWANNMIETSNISGGRSSGHVSGAPSADDEKGVIKIELDGSTYGKVYGYEYTGNYDYRLSNYIDITAKNSDRYGDIYVSGMYSSTPSIQAGVIGTGTLVRGGDTYINVYDSPNGTTQVWGLYGVDNSVRNDAVLNLNVTAKNTTSGYATQVIGMETLDTYPRYVHKQYSAINNNTIRIKYEGDTYSQTDTNPNIPFDVVGMATNSYAENKGDITIDTKDAPNAKVAGMVAYNGGVIVNTGKIIFNGNADNFTPFYAVGDREIITSTRKEKDGSITVLSWEKAYATVHNSGKVYINGNKDDDPSKLYTGNFYEGSSDWARSLYNLDEGSGQYVLDDEVRIHDPDRPDLWEWYSSATPAKDEPEEKDVEPTAPDYSASKTYRIAKQMGYISEIGGVFSVEGYQLAGDVTAGASLAMGGNQDVYIGNGQGEGAFIGNGDSSLLNITSESPLFEASYQNNANNANGLDIVLTRKSFNEVVSNDSLAAFLEANYTAGRNEAFFDKLKAFGDKAALSNSLDKLMGKDMLTRFNYEDLTMMRELNFDMNKQLFHNKEQAFSTAGFISPMAFRGDTGSNSRYSLFNKRSGALSVGLGVAFTNIKSNDAHNDDDRQDTMYQLIVPIGYRFNGFNLMTSPRIGYARGTYDRTGFDDQNYDGHIEKRVFGLMNEARYPITLGNWTLEPAAEFNVLGYTQRGHEDAKEYSLYIKSQKTYSVETGLGLYLGQEKELSPNTRLNLLAGVAVYHEFADPYKMELGMAGMDGSFTLRDENRSDNRGVIRLGVDYQRNNYSLYGSVMSYIDREVRSAIKTGFKWSF